MTTVTTNYDVPGIDVAWCPGCGNFPILQILKETLAEMELDPHDTVLVSGIGQAAKMPQYINVNYFNGLHGRSLPPATAIKAANPHLTVIAESGDGDNYGEGGNHFIHTIRRNPSLVHIVHDNMVYGLTKGQASPTSRKGFQNPIQQNGVTNEPFNPLAVAIALDASFVARTYCGDRQHAKEILKQALNWKGGYVLVDMFQPCVTFNKLNTYQWFKENTYLLPESHDPTDRVQAFTQALQEGPFPLGVFYQNAAKKPFEAVTGLYEADQRPLWQRERSMQALQEFIQNWR